MQEPELEENALTARVAAGRLTIERRSTDPAPPGQVTVTDPDGKTQTLNLTPTSPGRATATLPAATPGVWQASDGTRSRLCRGRRRQSAGVRRSARHRHAAAQAGAHVGRRRALHRHRQGRRAADVPELRRTEPDRSAAGSSWIGLERRHDHVVTGIASLTLLPSWIALPLMLGLLVLAWRREGQ